MHVRFALRLRGIARGDAGARPLAESQRFFQVLEALAGASVAVELREKDVSVSDREVLRLAISSRERLGTGVALFVNRRLDIALAAGAAGVHLPADGLPLARARAQTPRGFRIGVSTHSAAEARAAIADGADVVVIGPIFASFFVAMWQMFEQDFKGEFTSNA